MAASWDRFVEIIVTGSNDVYVIKGQDGKQVLIPAIKAVVKQIDLIRHTMDIDPLPGLLDGLLPKIKAKKTRTGRKSRF